MSFAEVEQLVESKPLPEAECQFDLPIFTKIVNLKVRC